MLKELHIKNWKAFEDKTIQFRPGLNLFVGPNGVGKTTLLDAVCLALTGGIQSGDYRALVRDKRRDASIELHLASAGISYFVKRRFSFERAISAEWAKDNNVPTQPTWEALTSALARDLRTDPVFFSRMVYMSEVEVFDYTKNPPAGALNTALERVLGIDSLRSLADFAERLSKSYTKSATGLRQELAKSATQSGGPVLDAELVREELARNKSYLEKVKRDLERFLAEAQRLQSISGDMAKTKNLLGALAGC